MDSIYCSGSSVSEVSSPSEPTSPLRVKHAAVLKDRVTKEDFKDILWIFFLNL